MVSLFPNPGMSMQPNEDSRAENVRRSLLLGLGFDGQDGHRRVTRSENFYLVGGSDSTHSLMQDQALAFDEEVSHRVKRLDELSPAEILDIARKIGMIRD